MDVKTELYETALKLFAEKGYEAVGVQEIVDGVSVTKPTLYHYFGSKRGLLEHVLVRGFSPLEQTLTIECKYNGDLTGTLQKISRCFFGFIEQNRIFFQLWISVLNGPILSEAKICAKPLLDRQFELIQQVFNLAEEDHGNMRGRSKIYAASFLGLINSTAWMMFDGSLTMDEGLLYRVLHQFEHGIYS